MSIFRKRGDHLFSDVDQKTRNQVIENIILASTPRKSFFVMIAVASVICTAGILMDSVALIIGAMLIAPMLSAIMSLALGLVVLNSKLFFRSFLVVLKALVLLFVSSFWIAVLFDEPISFSYDFLLKTKFELEIFIISIIVGFAASLSFIRKELSQYVTGTAIAVTLIPPATVSAIALRMGELRQFENAIWIFVINFVGIIISSMVVFLLARFHQSQKIVEKELAEEKKFLEKLTRRERFKKWLYEGIEILKKFIKR